MHPSLPLLFISHGAPTFALEPGLLGPKLAALGTQLPALRAVVVVSPHWQTPDLRVTGAAAPATIHDFGGFPAPLYALQYPAPGAPEIANEIVALLAQAGLAVAIDPARGLDHGVWVPLRHLLPDALVPVVQVSLPRRYGAADAFALGQALAPLRARGVLLIGSGSLTHNLYDLRAPDTPAVDYAVAFCDWIRDAVCRGDAAALLDYRREAPDAERAHPTDEHLLPLHVAAGAAAATSADDAVTVLDGGIEFGVLSMESYCWASRQVSVTA